MVVVVGNTDKGEETDTTANKAKKGLANKAKKGLAKNQKPFITISCLATKRCTNFNPARQQQKKKKKQKERREQIIKKKIFKK